MKFITISTFAIFATLGLGTANAQSLYTCGQGAVHTVRVITEMVAQPPIAVTIDPLGEPQVLVERAPDQARPAALVTVQLFDVMHTAEAFTANPENFDPTELEPGQPIDICVLRGEMILARGDGREFRAGIVRSEPIGQPLETE